MNINFSNEKQSNILITKSLDINILNNATITDTINDI
jgi:hypothetical protein